MSESAIVIGAGIVGLATARALAIRGKKVTVIDGSERAIGASIRNFGMLWPIGQPLGKLYERALLSRSIWKQVCQEANIWHDEAGSVHLAYNDIEADVLEEFYAVNKAERDICLLNPEQTIKVCSAIKANGLKKALFSREEIIINPRTAIPAVARYLQEKYGVHFIWNEKVTDVNTNRVGFGNHTIFADCIYICNGADFETLYPDIFKSLPLTKCKLQMMRLHEDAGYKKLGTSLCGGLSLIHYKSFASAPSLIKLKEYYNSKLPEHVSHGIHVMICQNESGQFTVGDSHEYGGTHDPFDKTFINDIILDYLVTFTNFTNIKIAETWNGIYAKATDGKTETVLSPRQGVFIINGLGGAGMTLSFGLSEQFLAGSYS